VVSGPSASLAAIAAAIRAGTFAANGLATTSQLAFVGVPSVSPSLLPNFPATPSQTATIITPTACVSCGTTCVGTSTTTGSFGTTTSSCACVPCSSVFVGGAATINTFVFFSGSCLGQTTISSFDSCIRQLAIASVCNNQATNNVALLNQGLLYNYPTFLGLPVGASNIIPASAVNCRRHHHSKKGLLGLLGLLGLIPLLLCCLCLLLLCMRRKRAAPDVHFATFDPHPAGPIGPMGGSLIAPSIAPGFGAPTALPVF